MPAGAYRSTWSSIPQQTDDGKTPAGALHVERLEIGERSTGELVAGVSFPEGVNTASVVSAKDGAQYWVERVQDADGRTVSVKLSSTAANEFYLNLDLYSAAGGTPAMTINNLSSDAGVQGPDGATIPDPYEDPDLPIAGFKQLKFRGTHREGAEIMQKVADAGFETFSSRYGDGVYEFGTYRELDARAWIEDNILDGEKWKPVKEQTQGNVGVYARQDGFRGEISIQWQVALQAFSVQIDDARLTETDDGPDETNYALTGNAVISPESFTIEDVTYRLKDSRSKKFSDEYGVKVRKQDPPRVYWEYVESWAYESAEGYPYEVVVSYITGDSPTDLDGIPVADLDDLDGSHEMTFMLPAMGGSATWDFEPSTP